jgi:hypothetical protein
MILFRLNDSNGRGGNRAITAFTPRWGIETVSIDNSYEVT